MKDFVYWVKSMEGNAGSVLLNAWDGENSGSPIKYPNYHHFILFAL